MRDGVRGLRSRSKEAVMLFSQECPSGPDKLLLLHFSHSPTRHLLSSLFLLTVLTFTHVQAHTAFTSHFLWRNASFYKQMPHRLTASLLFPPVSHTRRSLLCPPFVYFTPSIMQGLISQSRFELRHASAKSGEQNFCAGGSFPFTLA